MFQRSLLAGVALAGGLAMSTAALAQTVAPAPQTVTFAATPAEAGGVLVLPLGAAGELAGHAALLGDGHQVIERALTAGRFGYRARDVQTFRGIGGWSRVVVVGRGTTALDRQTAGMVAGRQLASEPGPVTLVATGLTAEAASDLATGFGIGVYRSDLHNTRTPRASVGGLTILTAEPDAGRAAHRRGAALVEAMAFTRDLSNEPANIIYPQTYVDRTRAAFAGIAGVTIQVLDEREMERLGMGALLGVGRGSERPPRLLVVRYRGQGAPAGGPVVLIGKGITFDSGGISIKPGAGMGNMKMDMSGAASITGAVLALARQGAPVDVVAISALAENMPDGRAIRPGDVLTAMNGRTIEIISTDAEGRLVLADAIVWAERNLDPAVIVDVATLTGSVGGALGDEYAGLFSRHDALAAQLTTAGAAVGEPLWRLPLHPSYAQDLASTTADIKNTGEGGAGAGTGAHFIGYFVDPDTPWAHLDIANVAYGGASDVKPAGSAGFAVRLLERFVLDWRPVPREPGTGGW
jgi:leucyl aminopeptidase